MSNLTKLESAFPLQIDSNKPSTVHLGMSLRDWFAGQALGHIPALLAANEQNKSVEQIASWAYQVADSMLAARAKTEGVQ